MPRKSDPDKPKPARKPVSKPRAPRRKKADSIEQPELELEDAPEQIEPEAPLRRRWPAIVAFVVIVMGMTFGGGGIAGWRYLQNWSARPYGAAGKNIEFKIAPGTSFMDSSSQLATQGLVSDETLFRAYALAERKHNKLQAGVYRIKLPVTPEELVARLQRGSFEGKITIPEGWTARQIDDYLYENNWIAQKGEWLALSTQPVGAEILGEALDHGVEGFCFPDTYMIEQGTSPPQIRDRMLKRFAEVWRELDPATRDPRSASLSMSEVIALASIVERETRAPEELPLIASVFLNRLEKRMKLQSCATVHYALGEVWNRKLTYDDLKLESEFNTYKVMGLPPAPIGSPGRGAIEAVLRPAKSDALYFVHRGDGTHEFTKTYREHQRAAQKHRRSDPNAALIGAN